MHLKNGQWEKDETKKEEITNFPEQGQTELSIIEGPCEIGEMGKGEDQCDLLSPSGKILNGKKGAAKEKHRGDKQEYRQIEHLDVADNTREEHADRSEGNPAQDRQRQDEEGVRISDESEKGDDHHHNRSRDHRFCRAPDDLRGDDLFEGKGRGQHCIEGFLIIHSHERRIGDLKKGIIHDTDPDQGGGDETDIGDFRALITDVSHQAAHTDAEGKEIKEGFEKGRDETDLPVFPVNHEVPLPDPNESPGDPVRNCFDHSLNSLPVNFKKTSSRVAILITQLPLQKSRVILWYISPLSSQ